MNHMYFVTVHQCKELTQSYVIYLVSHLACSLPSPCTPIIFFFQQICMSLHWVIHFGICSQSLFHTKGQYPMHFWINCSRFKCSFDHHFSPVTCKPTHAVQWCIQNVGTGYTLGLFLLLHITGVVWKCWIVGTVDHFNITFVQVHMGQIKLGSRPWVWHML